MDRKCHLRKKMKLVLKGLLKHNNYKLFIAASLESVLTFMTVKVPDNLMYMN
jgi:hypothetical protein